MGLAAPAIGFIQQNKINVRIALKEEHSEEGSSRRVIFMGGRFSAQAF
jgi:hypothetical protein